MSVIIRLQNLPWSANSYDIRSFFQGLSIPEGGVHIVGGELGDAFIAFSTDEDARQAMMRTGGKLKEVQVKLLLSSRNEMEKVIEAARSMTFPAAAAVPIPPAPAPPVVPLASPPVKKERDEESRESRRRSRSRSRDRKGSRRDSRDSGRRRRSRSRDRRRKKSRSRSRDRSSRDRYGRDLEKKVEVKKSSSKEKDKDTRNSRSAGAALGQTPLATNNAMPAGHGLGGDDAISVAMRKTLSALNLPFNMPQADSNAGADPRRGQRDGRNGPEEPVPPVVPAIADALNIARLTEILRQSQTQAFASNLNVKTDPSQVWLTPSPTMNPLAVNPTAIANIAAAAALPNLPLLGGITPNLLENLRRPGDNSRMGNRMQDSDTRGGDSGGSFGLPRGDSDRFGRFPEQNRFDRPGSFGPGPGFDDPRRDRNNRQLDERPRHGNFDRNGGMDRNRDSHSPDRRRDGNFDRRNDFGGPRGDPRSHGNMNMGFPADANSGNLCIELVGLPACSYSSIRRSLPRRECKVEEIRFKPTANGRRTAVRLASVEAKLEAMALRRVRVDDFFAEIAHLSDAEFNTFDEDRFNQRPEGPGPDNTGNQRDRFEDRRGDPRGDPRDRFNGSRGDVGSNNQDPRSRRNIPDANIIESSDCTVMKNLPNGTTDRDLCDFFSDIGLTPKKIHIMLDYNDEPSGEAFIEFWTADQAKLSTTKNGAPIGRNNIEVKLVGREEVEKALAGERPDDFAPVIKAMPMLPDMMMPGGPGLNGPPPLFPGGIPGGMMDMRPRFGMGFNPRPRFRGPSRPARFPIEGGPAAPPADCTVTMYNIPYRAGTDEILEFFGPKYDLTPLNVFRKLNDRGQPTSEARVVLKTPEEAVEAVKTLANRLIRERPIQLGILGKGDVDYEMDMEDQ